LNTIFAEAAHAAFSAADAIYTVSQKTSLLRFQVIPTIRLNIYKLLPKFVRL